MTGVLVRRLGHRQTRRENHVWGQGEGACLQPRRNLRKKQPHGSLDPGSILHICDKMNVCCLSHPDHAALFWQPQKTHTMTQEHFWVLVSCILLFYLRTGTLSYMKPQNFQFFHNTKNTNVVISYMCLSKKNLLTPTFLLSCFI